MIVTINLQKSDYLAAVKLHSKWSKKKQILIGGLISFLFVVAWTLWGTDRQSLGGAILGGTLGGIIAGGLTRYIYVPWRASRIFDQQKSLHRAYSVSWDENGVMFKDETGQTIVKWSDYLKYKENEKFVLLYHSDIMFNMLPKKAFLIDENLQEFCSYVRGRIQV
jgi:hypothetical protein